MCPENETWNNCGNPCNENWCNETARICTKQCNIEGGCYCNKGYKRDTKGQCIQCKSIVFHQYIILYEENIFKVQHVLAMKCGTNAVTTVWQILAIDPQFVHIIV